MIAPADEKARLQEIRERGKRQAARAAFDLAALSVADEDQNGAALLHNIGELYRVSGHSEEAGSAYTKTMALWNKSPATNQRGIATTQAGLDRLRAEQGATSSLIGLEVEPQVKNAPPVSSLPPESTQAQMWIHARVTGVSR